MNELTDEQIDALLVLHGKGDDGFHSFARGVIAADRALQAEQEPYAWCVASTNSADWAFAGDEKGVKENALLLDADCIQTKPFPLYTAPKPCHSQAPESAPQLSLSRTGATQAGQEPVAWMAHYTNKSGLQCVYTSSSYALAVENDVNSAPVPLYIAPPSTPVPDGRDAEIAALTAERDALRSRACR